jgi:thiamine pyrophosphokinase
MTRLTIGIVGSGPEEAVPDLSYYKDEVDCWIGADSGSLKILQSGLSLHLAVGDFDSVSPEELNEIRRKTPNVEQLPSMKDETDLELAVRKAIELKPDTIIMFGVTSGRKDHELINIQMLYRIKKSGINARIADKQNEIELTEPGSYSIGRNPAFPYISFLPFTEMVEGLSLRGFIYPLQNEELSWGSTLCISNELTAGIGHFSYRRGILLVIKSRDSIRQ